MSKIHQLPENLIAKIAAGEVIERPVFAIKELVENAIDAKATTIQVVIEHAGLKRIIVTDNGEGMNLEDLRLSYKHHTTSKLDRSLLGIKTLGFRGEALSSIAAISTMTIRSRPIDAPSGMVIEIDNGEIIKEMPIGMPHGTSIIVENLFSPVPVRKKFLKSTHAELRRIVDYILVTSVAYPSIRFELVHNNKTLLHLPEQAVADRIVSLFGTDIFSHMIPLQYEANYIHLHGFVAKPHITSAATNKQYIFVNNRYISHPRVSQTIKESFGTIIDSDAYPVFVLFIDIPHERVDVNIHPRKEHVTFLNNEAVMQALMEAMKAFIEKNNFTYLSRTWQKQNQKNYMPAHATDLLREEIQTWDIANLLTTKITNNTLQIHNLYILVPLQKGIMIIDQHAAHERILFEKLTMSFIQTKKKQETFTLKEPIILHVSAHDFLVYGAHQSTFTSLGFHIEEFGNNTVKITAVPALFRDHTIPKLFEELLMNMSNNKQNTVDSQSMGMLAFLACRTAIKAGDRLTKHQIKHLLDEFQQTPNNITCPHGRPTKVIIPLRDIDQLFKR